jgi:hypothetical protein
MRHVRNIIYYPFTVILLYYTPKFNTISFRYKNDSQNTDGWVSARLFTFILQKLKPG